MWKTKKENCIICSRIFLALKQVKLMYCRAIANKNVSQYGFSTAYKLDSNLKIKVWILTGVLVKNYWEHLFNGSDSRKYRTSSKYYYFNHSFTNNVHGQTSLAKCSEQSLAPHMQPFKILNPTFLLARVDYTIMFAIILIL